MLCCKRQLSSCPITRVANFNGIKSVSFNSERGYTYGRHPSGDQATDCLRPKNPGALFGYYAICAVRQYNTVVQPHDVLVVEHEEQNKT